MTHTRTYAMLTISRSAFLEVAHRIREATGDNPVQDQGGGVLIDMAGIALTVDLAETGDTYDMPEDGWVCFHCGDRFWSRKAAQDHFGTKPSGSSACTIPLADLVRFRQWEDQGKPHPMPEPRVGFFRRLFRR